MPICTLGEIKIWVHEDGNTIRCQAQSSLNDKEKAEPANGVAVVREIE